ncbi:MAG: putative deacylase, partial [Arenicella sp.]
EFPDGRDLNRVFPGSLGGSLASQFAYKFTKEIAPLVDYVIDFHTGGGERDNIAQIRCPFGDEKAFELAKVFGAPFTIHSGCISKSVRETLTKMGKKVLLFEGGKSNHLDEEVIQCGLSGALNVMRHLGLRDGEVEKKETICVTKSKWIRALFSGMLRLKVKNGASVKKKEVLAVITDSYGDFEKKILAPFDCHIVCTNTTAIVNKGDALFHVSVEIQE